MTNLRSQSLIAGKVPSLVEQSGSQLLSGYTDWFRQILQEVFGHHAISRLEQDQTV